MLKRCLTNIVNKAHLYSRSRNILKEKPTATNDILWKTIENSSIKSTGDWKNVRNEILNICGTRGPITRFNIDAMTVGVCTSKEKYDLALSYLDFLQKEDIKLNLATLGKYFKLLYIKGRDGLQQEDEERILMLYDNVRKSHPVLDALTLDNVIQAISLTNKWKLCLDLLEEIKVTATPSATVYGAIVSAAFSNNDNDLAWQLLNEMLENGKTVHEAVYSSYFNKVARNTRKSDVIRELEKMFYFLQKNCIKIDSATMEHLVKLLQKYKIIVQSSIVTNRGLCKCCKSKLQTFDLTENEFNDLKNKIVENVIVGKDVFNKTTSDELQKFKNFISNMEKFDVVVDGLNVAYSVGVQQSLHVTSGLVASVVAHFVKKNMKVLVLGRNHMNKWPRENWGYILQNATVFLTQDLSQDDPYLLYCALNCGKDTIIITKDLMRGHKFLLRNMHLKVLFDRWLSQRQYQLVHVQESGNPIFKKPFPFSNVAQKNQDYWHVPYVLDNQVKNTVPNTLLCIKCQY